MRQYQGTDQRDPFAIQKIDYFLRDLSAAIRRVDNGERPSGGGGTLGITDHGELSGLSDDDHLQYLLLAGREGGQVAYGGTAATDTLNLNPTSGASTIGLTLTPKGLLYGTNGGVLDSADVGSAGLTVVCKTSSPQATIITPGDTYPTLSLQSCVTPTDRGGYGNQGPASIFVGNLGTANYLGYQGIGIQCWGLSIGDPDHFNNSGKWQMLFYPYARVEYDGTLSLRNTYADTIVPLEVRGYAFGAQTGHLQNWMNGGATVLSYIDYDGSFHGTIGDGSIDTSDLMTLSTAQTVTGKKSFECETDSLSPYTGANTTLQLSNTTTGGALDLYVHYTVPSATGQCYLRAGVMLTSPTSPATGSLLATTATVGATTTVPIGSAGDYLRVVGGVPTWSTVAGTDLPDHTHAAGQGANIPASSVTNVACTLAGEQIITGDKLFYGRVYIKNNGVSLVAQLLSNPAQATSISFTLPAAAGTLALTSDIGTLGAQAANNVAITGGSITGITDLAVADGGTGASTLDGAGIVTKSGTQTLTGKKTFPADGTNAPVFVGDVTTELKPALVITEDNDGDPQTLNVYASPVVGSGVCMLTGGSVFTTETTVLVANGGTGASTLAGAGITTFVGTPWNGTGLTGDAAGVHYLMTTATNVPGFYRISVYGRCTTAGTAGSFTIIYVRSNDGTSTGATAVILDPAPGATPTISFPLTFTTVVVRGTITVYSASGDIEIWNGSGTYNDSPVFTIRARLEYLGA